MSAEPSPLPFHPLKQQLELVLPVLKTALKLMLQARGAFFILLVLHTAIQAVLQYQLATGNWPVPRLPVLTPRLLIAGFFSAAAIHLLLWQYRPGLTEALSIAARAYASLIAVVLIATALTQFGLIMMILPGLAAYVLFRMAPVVVMAERPGIRGAFEASVTRTLPYAATMTALVVSAALIGFMAFFLLLVVSFIGAPFLPEDSSAAFMAAVQSGLGVAWLTLVEATVATAFYLHLRNDGRRLGI